MEEKGREERGERGDGLSEPICVSSWAAVPRSADRRRCKTAETHREATVLTAGAITQGTHPRSIV